MLLIHQLAAQWSICLAKTIAMVQSQLGVEIFCSPYQDILLAFLNKVTHHLSILLRTLAQWSIHLVENESSGSIPTGGSTSVFSYSFHQVMPLVFLNGIHNSVINWPNHSSVVISSDENWRSGSIPTGARCLFLFYSFLQLIFLFSKSLLLLRLTSFLLKHN